MYINTWRLDHFWWLYYENYYVHTNCFCRHVYAFSASRWLSCLHVWCRVQLECDGTRWRTGGEVKGKLANGVGSQYPSHYLGHVVYPALLPLMRIHRLPVVDWTDAPAVLNGLVRFAERRNLVSARVPSHFKRILPDDVQSKSNFLFLPKLFRPHSVVRGRRSLSASLIGFCVKKWTDWPPYTAASHSSTGCWSCLSGCVKNCKFTKFAVHCPSLSSCIVHLCCVSCLAGRYFWLLIALKALQGNSASSVEYNNGNAIIVERLASGLHVHSMTIMI